MGSRRFGGHDTTFGKAAELVLQRDEGALSWELFLGREESSESGPFKRWEKTGKRRQGVDRKGSHWSWNPEVRLGRSRFYSANNPW